MDSLLIEDLHRIRMAERESEARALAQAMPPRGAGWDRSLRPFGRWITDHLRNLPQRLHARRGRRRLPRWECDRFPGAPVPVTPRPLRRHSGYWLTREGRYPESVEPFWLRW